MSTTMNILFIVWQIPAEFQDQPCFQIDGALHSCYCYGGLKHAEHLLEPRVLTKGVVVQDTFHIMKVTIEPHNPAWLEEFENERKLLLQILLGVPIVQIEHVGSTAVPGLAAKPVLDIDIIIPLASLDAGRLALAAAGYADLGEMNGRAAVEQPVMMMLTRKVPGRFAFREPGFGKDFAAFGHYDGKMRRNTYLMLEGCTSLRNHLDMKRMLLNDPVLREEYSQTKLQLAAGDYADIGAYVLGKNMIILKILRAAGWTEDELAPVIAANS